METVRLKARIEKDGKYMTLLYPSYKEARWFRYASFARKFPILAKQIKAAKGKCVDIQVSMGVVE